MRDSSFQFGPPQTRLRPAAINSLAFGFLCVYLLLAVRLGVVGMVASFVAVAGLAWLMLAPFSLYLWLIVSWPVLDLYVRLKLGGLPDISYARVVVGGLVLATIVTGLASRRKFPKLGLPVVAYLAVECLQYSRGYLWGDVPRTTLADLLGATLLPVAMYWLARCFITSRREVRALVAAVIAACVVCCATGLYKPRSIFKTAPSRSPPTTRRAIRAITTCRADGRAACWETPPYTAR